MPRSVALIVGAATAIAVAVAAAVFAIVDTTFVRAVPMPDGDRLVRLSTTTPDRGEVVGVNLPELDELVRTSASVAAAAAYSTNFGTLQAQEAERAALTLVRPGFFDAVRLPVRIGRLFEPADFAPGAEPVLVVSDRLWRRAFQSSEAVVGTVVPFGGRRLRIVGVLERGLVFPIESDAWAPLVVPPGSPLLGPDLASLPAIARLTDGATAADLDRDLEAAAPGARRFIARPLAAALFGTVRPTVALVAGVLAALLAMAACGIGSLLTSESLARAPEFALRAALGGSRLRILARASRTILSPIVVGGLIGFVFAPRVLSLVLALSPDRLSDTVPVVVDARAAVAAAGILLFAGIAALIPTVLVVLSRDPAASLASPGRVSETPSRRRLGDALVAAQMAAAVVLVVTAFLLARVFVAAVDVDPGVDTRSTVVFHLSPLVPSHPTADARASLFDDLRRSIAALPGVTNAGIGQHVPFGARPATAPIHGGDPAMAFESVVQSASPGFLDALGAPLLAGRGFLDTDGPSSPRVAILSHGAARLAFGDPQAALDRTIVWDDTEWTVVGIAGDKQQVGLHEPPSPELYVPWSQTDRFNGWMAVRTSGDPLDVLPAIRAIVARRDPALPVAQVSTLDARLSGALAHDRFRASVATAIGLAALAVATMTVYGTIAAAVGRRRRELALRTALGAPRGALARRAIARALAATLGGIVLGLPATLVVANRLDVFRPATLPPVHAMAFAAATTVLVLVATIAAWLPARAAGRVDPTELLRSE